jgi:transposase
MPHRGDLTDQQWEGLKALLPPQKPLGKGRPAKSHRQMLNGMLWICRTGAPWRDLPPRYGKVQSVFSRFRRWRENGVWAQVFSTLQSIAEAEGRIDWQLHFVDSTIVRAHQHAAGAKGGTQTQKRSGAARAASPRRSTSGRKAKASRLFLCLPPANAERLHSLKRSWRAAPCSGSLNREGHACARECSQPTRLTRAWPLAPCSAAELSAPQCRAAAMERSDGATPL